MAKIAGTYTIRTADQPGQEGQNRGTILTVEVSTGNPDDAARIAEVLGHDLERLGLTVPIPTTK